MEETNADLQLKMEDLNEELTAARATNRELMTQLNTKGRAPIRVPGVAQRFQY